jgi:hypothetical protein
VRGRALLLAIVTAAALAAVSGASTSNAAPPGGVTLAPVGLMRRVCSSTRTQAWAQPRSLRTTGSRAVSSW